jgi:hypothetical protein
LTNFHYFAIKKKGPQQPGQGNFLKKIPKKSSHFKKEESYVIIKIFGGFWSAF